MPLWQICHYHVTFFPEQEQYSKSAILKSLKKHLGGYVYDGESLFLMARISDKKPFTVNYAEDQLVTVTLKFVGEVSKLKGSYVQVLNLILRRSMKALKLQLIGRNYYDPEALV